MKLKLPDWFSLLVFLIVLMFFFGAFSFTTRAKTIPLIVAAPTLFLIALQIVLEVLPSPIGRWYQGKNIQNQLAARDELAYAQTDCTASKPVRQDLVTVACLAVLFLLVWLLGLIAGGLLFIFVYYKFIAGESWLSSISTALIVGLISYGLFEVILKTSTWRGFLF